MPSCAQEWRSTSGEAANGAGLMAGRTAVVSAARGAAGPCRPGSDRSCVAIFPSRISMRRGVTAAISGSWVTSTMVRPSWLSLRKRLRMASPVWESRLPVGSSAKMMRGLLTRARAIAARCCWPPESWLGRCLARLARSTGFQGRHRALAALLAGDAAVDHRQFHVLHHIELGQQIEELEHEPDLAVANGGKLPRGGVLDHHAVELDRPFGGRVQAAEDVHQGGLAAPGRADDRDEFALPDVQRDIIQGADFLLAEAIDFADVAEFDEGHGGVRRET